MLYVTSPEQAKKSARALTRFIKNEGCELGHGQALNAVAVMAGAEDWNALLPALLAAEELGGPVNALLAFTLSRVATTLLRVGKSLSPRAEGLPPETVRRAVSALDEAAEEAKLALTQAVGARDTVDEVYGALGDLVESLVTLPSENLPDRFNHRALSDAKIALAMSRPHRYSGRTHEVNHCGNPVSMPSPIAKSGLRKLSSLHQEGTCRLFYLIAETTNGFYRWSPDLLLALPGETAYDVSRRAFEKREPDIAVSDVVFHYSDANPERLGGFVVYQSEHEQVCFPTVDEAVRHAKIHSNSCNECTSVWTRTTGVRLASFNPTK